MFALEFAVGFSANDLSQPYLPDRVQFSFALIDTAELLAARPAPPAELLALNPCVAAFCRGQSSPFSAGESDACEWGCGCELTAAGSSDSDGSSRISSCSVYCAASSYASRELDACLVGCESRGACPGPDPAISLPRWIERSEWSSVAQAPFLPYFLQNGESDTFFASETQLYVNLPPALHFQLHPDQHLLVELATSFTSEFSSSLRSRLAFVPHNNKVSAFRATSLVR
jgi:hypothetical protein